MNRPILVMSHVSLLSQSSRYSLEEKKAFAKRLGRAGYDFLRVFATGGDDGARPLEAPFSSILPTGSGWDLRSFNEIYFDNLAKLHSCLLERGVKLYIDIYNSCQHRCYDDPWSWNWEDIRSWWDTSPAALEVFKLFVDRLKLAAPTAKFGLGNELKIANEWDSSAWNMGTLFQWAKDWAWPRIAYLKSIGQEIPILFSGSGHTAHKIMGACGTEDGYVEKAQVAQIIHGIGMITHVEPGDAKTLDEWLRGISKDFDFGWSDDGVHTQAWNRVPLGFRGPGNYDATHGGPRPNWPANTKETIKVIQKFRDILKKRFIVIDVLPRELSDKQHLNELTEEALQRGPDVMRAVYGVNLARPPMEIDLEICSVTGHLPNDTCPFTVVVVSEDDPERPRCMIDHTPPPKPKTCSDRYGKPWTKQWQPIPWILCQLGKK